MRKINILFILAVFFLFACEDNTKGPVLEETIPQELTNPTEGMTVKITAELLDSNFTFSWNAATFNLDLPSPTYIVELDQGANSFDTPIKLKSSTDLFTNILYSKLNKIVIDDFGAEDSVAIPVKARVISSIEKQVEQYSSVITFHVIPYFEPEPIDTTPVDTTPVNVADTVYLVGEATTVGWEASLALPIINDGTSDIYTITTEFKAGGMKILEVLGAWAPQWGLDTGDETGGTLKYRPDEATTDPPEIPSPGTGTYRLDVNIKALEYTFTAM